jgi:hypothetical protein
MRVVWASGEEMATDKATEPREHDRIIEKGSLHHQPLGDEHEDVFQGGVFLGA